MINSNNEKIIIELLDLLKIYEKQNNNPAQEVVNYVKGDVLKDVLNLTIANDGVPIEQIMSEIKTYLQYSVRVSHPQFNNQLYASPKFESLLGEIVSFVTNTSMATFEIAPVATLIEKKLCTELANRIGYVDGSGLMVTGGSNANMLAIHCARNKFLENVKNMGNQGKQLCVFVSEEAHYSFKKAVMLMGIGLENLIQVNCCENGKMITADLERNIQQSIDGNKMPIMIASTAGTTVKGAFDSISENNIIAQKYHLWHHVDGAWGGAVMFSSRLNSLLKGMADSDSFAFDGHKLLGTGLITSFLLVKDKKMIESANKGGGGDEYLFHPNENADYDLGPASLQCGRKVDALKLWLAWKSQGNSGFEQLVEAQLEKMLFFKRLINENLRLKLVCEPEYLNVCFQVLPKNNEKDCDLNNYNLELRFKLVKSGKFLVNYSTDKLGNIFFRYVFANSHTTKKDLEHFLQELLRMS